MNEVDEKKVLSLLRRRIFNTKHVARGTGLSTYTLFRILNEVGEPRPATVKKILLWMQSIKEQIP